MYNLPQLQQVCATAVMLSSAMIRSSVVHILQWFSTTLFNFHYIRKSKYNRDTILYDHNQTPIIFAHGIVSQ